MADKAVPEYMKRYMENIGESSFTDYELLSREYHKSIQVYHELKFPSRITPKGRNSFTQDINTDLYRIDEEFKSKAMDVACKKHGYKDPGYQSYDASLTGIQEGTMQGGIPKDDFGRTPEDIRANKAHAAFEKENPDKMQYKEGNRAIIDYYYSGPEGPAQREEDRLKALSQQWSSKTVEKETRSEKAPRSDKENQALAKDFGISGEDIAKDKSRISMSDRFFMSLPKNDAPSFSKNDVSKGKDDIEMERDF